MILTTKEGNNRWIIAKMPPAPWTYPLHKSLVRVYTAAGQSITILQFAENSYRWTNVRTGIAAPL